MTQAKSTPGRREMGRARSPEPLDFFIWTVEVLSSPPPFCFASGKNVIVAGSSALYLVHCC
ncbi:Sterile alpha motif (SAM) domain-containing protein [Zea mays]|uniref:Sterile alpha motif (SAM) domain-containing protein n=1 Tax=Zea mays TaxID=4577 RepID=A0A1D6LF86_MAIZE|nr:Sterile alpha motif (SAM) domain-containing protein [Zea mays]